MADRVNLSWLRDNWRPLSALIMALLPVAKAFGYAPGLTEEQFDTLLQSCGIFLGLYAAGRTAEKVADSVAATRLGVAQSVAVTDRLIRATGAVTER